MGMLVSSIQTALMMKTRRLDISLTMALTTAE